MTVVDDVRSEYVRPATVERDTTNERIAAALGNRDGSYERLIGLRICSALGIDPTFQGQLLQTEE